MSFDVLTSGGGSFSPTFADIEDVRYVSASSIVSGTRDGSFYRPFSTIQDAIDFFGEPVDQADYRSVKTINVLDNAVYTEDLVFPMRKWVVRGDRILIDGDVTLEVNDALRYGASGLGANPQLNIENSLGNVDVTFNNFTVQLASGGTTLNNFRVLNINFQGVIFNFGGTLTINDGVIGSNVGRCSVSARRSLIGNANGQNAIYILYDSSIIPSGGEFRCGFIQLMNNCSLFGNITQAFTGTILTQTWKNTDVSTATVFDFEQPLTNDLQIDSYTYTGVLENATVTTNTPNWTLKDTAETIAYDNSDSGLTATNVKDAIDELDTRNEQGADVASASNMDTGGDNNAYEITGSTNIDFIVTAGYTNGNKITLVFSGSLDVNHNSSLVPGGSAAIITKTGAAVSVTAGDVMQLQLLERGGTQRWYEL